MTKLAFLNLSFNKIKEYEAEELPQNLMILKLMNNPCERSMPNYRRTAVLRCESLDEMDNVQVHIAERMHYQGIIEIDLDKQLGELKQRKLEQELKDKLEDEVMKEYLDETGLISEEAPNREEAREEARKENWDSFQRLDEFQELNKGFMNIKKQLDKNRKMVKHITHKRKHLLYEHYKSLEERYMKDREKQSLVEEYKSKNPEEYESKCFCFF